MKEKIKGLENYAQAVACLPPRLMNLALTLPENVRARVEELRLRAGQPLCWYADGQEHETGWEVIRPDELRDTLARASRWSVHTYADPLRQGYLPLAGGHRLGVCGTVALEGGQPIGMRVVSSLSLRIARAWEGACTCLNELYDGHHMSGTLILSRPGGGKTTFLRDLIRQLSMQGVRVAVADERGEIAAIRGGLPQFDVGRSCDILDGCPKAVAALRLVRTMAPDVLALDEVTDPADLEAIRYASNCGVSVLATIHAADSQELSRKPFFRALCESEVFSKLVILECGIHGRSQRIEKLERSNEP